jgi:hypothetical protein
MGKEWMGGTVVRRVEASQSERKSGRQWHGRRDDETVETQTADGARQRQGQGQGQA